MTQSICPNCGASVESTERACSYCGAALTPVPAAPDSSAPTVRASREELESALQEAEQPAPAYRSSAEAMDAVKAELRAGRPTEAANIYRDYFKVDQAAAQSAVEQIEFDLKATTPSRRSDAEVPAFARPDAPAPAAPAANLLDAPKKTGLPKWVWGCLIVVILLFCCLCLAALALLTSGPLQGNFRF